MKARKEHDTETGGLFAGGRRVALQGVSIQVRARGVATHVTIAQRYRNDERVPVEAVYTFPMPESAAVCGFEVTIDGRRLSGRVVERERAFEEYDDALARGSGAFLLDQDRPNVFTASVGNLLPGQEVVLRISYVAEMEQSGRRMRLLIPTTVSPRYVPPDQARTMDPAELDHLTPPVADRVPYGLELSVDLEAASDIAEVECPSHPARIVVGKRSVRLELSGTDIQLDRDFVLDVLLAQPHRAGGVVARDDRGDRWVQVTWFPDLADLPRAPADYVFLLDRSGSMDGASIDSARNALLIALRSLAEGDRFDVVGFGSSFERVFGSLRPYDDTHLEQATQKVARWRADLGGTELMGALRAVFSTPRDGRMLQILVLTDGEVTDEEACASLVRRHAAQARVFTLGIGEGVSEYLVRSLARAAGGVAEFLHPRERTEPVVMRQLARMTRPALQDARIDWGTLRVTDVAPTRPGPLFDGNRLVVYGRIEGGKAGQVAFEATGPNGQVRFPVRLDLRKPPDDATVARLAGRTAIRELEESDGEPSGSRQTDRKAAARRRQLADLACRHGLLCSATSMVVVDEREAAPDAPAPELRRIPVALTAGWHGRDRLPSGVLGAVGLLGQALGAGGAFASVGMAVTAAFGRSTLSRSASWIPASREADEAVCCMEPSAPPDPCVDLVVAQKADGHWELTAKLAAAMGVPVARLQELAAKLGLPSGTGRQVVATLAALHVLAREWPDREAEWRMSADKARLWLAARKVKPPAGARDLTAWFDGMVGAPAGG